MTSKQKRSIRGRSLILRGKYTEQLTRDTEDEILGDLLTIEEYLCDVECTAFIDGDGYGHPVKDNMEDANLFIYPSQGDQHIPMDATHIVWFNK